ncbi:hypothetical protein ACFL2V_22055, partial [Pseudomonadota bacterium]
IIDHMKKTGEWGEYFPSNISPFAYNETIALDHFPVPKEEAINMGLNWLEKLDEKPKISESTRDVQACNICHSPYKNIPQELKYYGKMGLQAPINCYNCRRKERMKLRKK